MRRIVIRKEDPRPQLEYRGWDEGHCWEADRFAVAGHTSARSISGLELITPCIFFRASDIDEHKGRKYLEGRTRVMIRRLLFTALLALLLAYEPSLRAQNDSRNQSMASTAPTESSALIC